MANEGNWEVITGSITLDNRNISNSPQVPAGDAENSDPTAPSETRAVQLGSEYLYIIKEQLVKAGWQVVKSCYRVGTEYFNFTAANKALLEVSMTKMADNTWDADLFTVVDGDGWLPENGFGGGVSPYDKEFSTSNNPAWSVIYPGYVSIGAENTRRGLQSSYFSIGAYALPAGNDMLRIGRSWILLKAPPEFAEFAEKTGNTGRNYHLVIDYVHNSLPYWASQNTNIFDTFKPGAPDNDFNDEFGSYVNLVILPDWDADEDLDISQFKRPSHQAEVGCVVRTTAVGYGGTYFKFVKASDTEANNDTTSKYFVNTLHDKENGSTVLLGSIQGTPIFSVVLGTIADSISNSIIQTNDNNSNSHPGTRFFNFWSNIQRGPLNAGRSLATNQIINLEGTIYDGSETYASTYVYRRYSPDSSGVKYRAEIANTCIPAFHSKTGTTTKGSQTLLSTIPFAKTTSEYTYMEWPLPLISVDGNSSNFSYLGRMMDIKLGHAYAPNGILAKEDDAGANFDRISFSGLWLPYSGSSALLF